MSNYIYRIDIIAAGDVALLRLYTGFVLITNCWKILGMVVTVIFPYRVL
ncbi:MAG: hypothetical protein AAGG00_08055 [Cyanobacteria bacterium P01_H01_bin.150]